MNGSLSHLLIKLVNSKTHFNLFYKINVTFEIKLKNLIFKISYYFTISYFRNIKKKLKGYFWVQYRLILTFFIIQWTFFNKVFFVCFLQSEQHAQKSQLTHCLSSNYDIAVDKKYCTPLIQSIFSGTTQVDNSLCKSLFTSSEYGIL